ncbi:hypothetical protein HanRHA438_Chr00c68g0862111 [Helianthus annuus]|nr:hypothetical protein HanPSC8_Chr09g0400201 [Helianthus annuus]KAJ0953510.1 hypothetical protein HanRHA438_Chr00c68g0862111 [Helianthus annuus]
MMLLGRVGRRIGIVTSARFRSKCLSTNNSKHIIESNKNGESSNSLTHHDSYRDLDKLDFMTAAKILFTTPPKKKKFRLVMWIWFRHFVEHLACNWIHENLLCMLSFSALYGTRFYRLFARRLDLFVLEN